MLLTFEFLWGQRLLIIKDPKCTRLVKKLRCTRLVRAIILAHLMNSSPSPHGHPRLHQGPPGVVLVLVQQQEKTQNQLPVRIVVLSPRAACRRRQWQQAPHRRPPGSSSSRSLSCLLSPRRAAMNSRGSSLADGGRHLLQLRGLLVVVAHEQGCRPRHCWSGALLLATHSTTPGAGS